MKTGGVEMFGFEESLIDDLITLDVLGLLDDEKENDDDNKEEV